MSSSLIVEDIGSIRRMTLNQPRWGNPLSYELSDELRDRLIDTEKDAAVTAIVITGAGKSFCVGGDQKNFRNDLEKGAPEVLQYYPPMDIFKLARNFQKPLIAAVNGPAYGAGLGMACIAHVAIASETACFGAPEIKLGMFPLTLLPVIRPVLGERRSLELALTGRSMTADEALQVGLVSKVVPGDTLQDEAMALATEIGSYSPLALRLGLRAMQLSADMGFDEAIEYLNAMRTTFFGSEDLKSGVTAFLEKRPPVWRGK